MKFRLNDSFKCDITFCIESQNKVLERAVTLRLFCTAGLIECNDKKMFFLSVRFKGWMTFIKTHADTVEKRMREVVRAVERICA